MSAELAELYVTLRGNTASFIADMAGAQTASKDLEGQVTNTAKVLATVLVAGAVAAGGAIAWAVKGADTFNQQMTLVRTQAGDTADKLTTLSDAVLGLAPAVGQTPEALAQALFHIASAGYTGAQALTLLKSAAELADVGQSDLTDTTNGLIAVMNSGVPDIHNSTQAIAMLNAFVGNGNYTMQDLVGSIAKFMPVAGTFGVSAQSMGAALDYMTVQGYGTAQASTALRMSLALMAAPTHASASILADLGLTATQTGNMTAAMTQALAASGVTQTQLASDLTQPDGLVVALQDLKTHMEDAGVSSQEQAAILARAFGGGRTGAAIIDLYNHLDQVAKKYTEIGSSQDSWSSDLATQMATASQHNKDFSATIDAMRVKIGDIFVPFEQGVVKAFQGALMKYGPDAVNWIENTAIPDLEWLGREFVNDVWPSAEKVATTLEHLGSDVLPIFGGVIKTVVAPVLTDAVALFKWFGNNGWAVDAIFAAWAARWATMEALGIGSMIEGWVGALGGLSASLAKDPLAALKNFMTGGVGSSSASGTSALALGSAGNPMFVTVTNAAEMGAGEYQMGNSPGEAGAAASSDAGDVAAGAGASTLGAVAIAAGAGYLAQTMVIDPLITSIDKKLTGWSDPNKTNATVNNGSFGGSILGDLGGLPEDVPAGGTVSAQALAMSDPNFLKFTQDIKASASTWNDLAGVFEQYKLKTNVQVQGAVAAWDLLTNNVNLTSLTQSQVNQLIQESLTAGEVLTPALQQAALQAQEEADELFKLRMATDSSSLAVGKLAQLNRYASGGVSTSPELAWVGEGGPEVHIPQSIAGPAWPYLLAILNGGGSPSGGGGGGGVGGAGLAPSGGGGGVSVSIGQIVLPGVTNPTEFAHELQAILVTMAKQQGLPTLFGAYR
jgi:TP901 family phage tail tape measure protein